MISSPALSKRQLIPRWRSLSRTIALRELASPADQNEPFKIPPLATELVRRLERWRGAPNVVAAAELVESAIVHAQENEAVDAARFLVDINSRARPLVRKHAALLLKRTGHEADIPNDLAVGQQDTADLWRRRTRLHPYDPLPWVELALAQISKGHDKHALRSMTVALQVAPQNRHVLRSAARLHLHMHDPERAHDLLRRNEATPHDPWLMAAEIALAPGAKRKSSLVKKGLAILERDSQRPRQVTELAGALGTTLLEDGNRKRGRRLLQDSMRDPTGNALAQAEWVSQVYRETLVYEEQLKDPRDRLEAMAMHLYRAGDFARSLAFALDWIEEEPFSNNAYRAATAAALVDENYEVTEQIAQRGLQYSPKSVHLRASLVYAAACLGRLDEAEQLINTILLDNDDEAIALVLEADRGLIALRRGQHAEGRAFYQAAIQGFRRRKDLGMEILAHAYFSREAARAGLEDAAQLLTEAEKQNEPFKLPNAQRPIDAARLMLMPVTAQQHKSEA